MIVDYFKEHKRMFMAGLTALCVAMMIISATVEFGAGFLRNSVGFAFTPVMSAFSNTSGWIAGRVDSLINIGSLEADNIRLTAENEYLQMHNDLQQVQLARLAELEEILGIRDSLFPSFDTMAAHVIATDAGIWYSTSIINVGRNRDIVPNMPVVVGGALYGRVDRVNWNNSRLRSIIADTSRIHVAGRRTGCEGFAQGCYTLMPQGLLRLDFSSQNAEFEVNDIIETSALSSFFPPGLRVGEIIEIRTAENGDRYAILQPIADMRNTGTVLILMDIFEFPLED